MSFRKNISYALFPLTMWYAVGVRFRNLFYALGIKKQEAPHITTIGVGNLSTGGTGKTPHVEYLIRLLADKYPTAVLSRGYKRKSKGYAIDDGNHDASLLGDEPAMIASKFPQVQVAVCEKRVEGVKQLMEQEQKPQLIILDDVFQHRAIKPSINILLTEYSHPYFADHILPYGDLREFKKARFRANIVIVTKCPAILNPVEKHNILHDLKLLNYQKVFFSYFAYGELQTLDGQPAPVDLRRVDNVLCVTGIAHPRRIAPQRQSAAHGLWRPPRLYSSRHCPHTRNLCRAPGRKQHHHYHRERCHASTWPHWGPAIPRPPHPGSFPQRKRQRLRPSYRVGSPRKHFIPLQTQHLELSYFLI